MQRLVVKETMQFLEQMTHISYKAMGDTVTNERILQIYNEWFKDWNARDLRYQLRRLHEAIFLEAQMTLLHDLPGSTGALFRAEQGAAEIHCKDVDSRCGMCSVCPVSAKARTLH